MSVDQDLSLLWQAARVSPHLREAVERIESEIQRLRSALQVYANAWPEDFMVDMLDDVWHDPSAVARKALSCDGGQADG